MTTASFTIQENIFQGLSETLLGNEEERAAYLLCSVAMVAEDPWDRQTHHKYLCYEHLPVPNEEIISASKNHVTWSTNSFVKLLKRAKNEGLVPAIVHSHPGNSLFFSEQDNRNEADLVKLAQNRNGHEMPLISIVLTQEGGIIGRVWYSPDHYIPFRMIRVLGNRYVFHYSGRGKGKTPEIFSRQALALGDALVQDLKKLRVAVVGTGGTGSATALKLARLGVGQILLIEKDIVEETNLNRLQGATRFDADAMNSKADVIAQSIAAMGLGVRAIPIKHWVSEPECRDLLKTCDIIFGCTDDNAGRMLLNRFAYFYLTPVIDMGLIIDVSDDKPPKINDLSGRVTSVFPGNTCMLCRKIIDPKIAYAEELKRANPNEYERQKKEAYVLGEGNPSPAVITFTDGVSNMAVDELIHRMTGYRTVADASEWRMRYHYREYRKTGAPSNPDCPICISREYWGRGDIDPFLDRVG